jgi:hypothetical protein
VKYKIYSPPPLLSDLPPHCTYQTCTVPSLLTLPAALTLPSILPSYAVLTLPSGLTPSFIRPANHSPSLWSCPHHKLCVGCEKTATAVGFLFRCAMCPNAHCEDCRSGEQEVLSVRLSVCLTDCYPTDCLSLSVCLSVQLSVYLT